MDQQPENASHRPRSVDLSDSHIPTKIVLTILGAAVACILSGAFAWYSLKLNVETLAISQKGVATKEDLRGLQDTLRASWSTEVDHACAAKARFYIEHAAIRVYRVPGKTYMAGKIEWPIKVDDE